MAAYVVEVTKVVTTRQTVMVSNAKSTADALRQAEEIAADNGDGAGYRTAMVHSKVVA